MISVLYVDDEPDLLELCKIFLEQDGDFRVETVQSPLEALPLLEKNPYDAIVCDYQMPEMDGISLLKQVRGHTRRYPVHPLHRTGPRGGCHRGTQQRG